MKKLLKVETVDFYGCENFIFYLFAMKYSKKEINKYFKKLDPEVFRLKNGGSITRITTFIEKNYFNNPEPVKLDEKIKRIEICKCAFTTKDNTSNPNSQYLESLYRLIPSFERYATMFHQLSDVLKGNDPMALRLFINTYWETGPVLINKFIKSINKDFDSIALAITTGINSGLVEGGNNKLKLLERISYGKLSIETLEKKFILSYLKSNSNLIFYA